ncbi:hypothetical protein [Nioella sediminis]|uniref:hypothetical protein n=1 Tax=Nioella sediminis TaxID=1912092 RepID=UPI0010395224|nr:hypothetical protein [Nioella sediminis]
MILKIAIVPVMLLSILWRNRREKRRRAQTQDRQREERAPVRREVIDLPAADIPTLQEALNQVKGGACLVSPRNEPVTEPMLRRDLASALMDAGRVDAVSEVIGENADDSPGLMLCAARLHALTGNEDAARQILSVVADRQLESKRIASRGLKTHLAEMLAEPLRPAPKSISLSDSALTEAGPLELLSLSGREDEAKALASELATVLDKALRSGGDDPELRIDGLPVAAVRRSLATLHVFYSSGGNPPHYASS